MPFIINNPSSGSVESNRIQELTADPPFPAPEEVWVERLGTGVGIPDGTPIGLLLTLTYTDNTTPFSYRLSYQTIEGPIVRVDLN